jgi:hypothetical protein
MFGHMFRDGPVPPVFDLWEPGVDPLLQRLGRSDQMPDEIEQDGHAETDDEIHE